MKLPSIRALNFLAFLACASLMAFAFYLEYAKDLEPCPLCMLQRIMVITVGVLFLLAAIHNPGKIGGRIYGVLTLFFAGLGAALAGRHVWLQHLPADQVPVGCGATDLGYILDIFPLFEALMVILEGDGHCAETVWTFLGFSIPEWTLAAFIGFILVLLIQIFRPNRNVH